MSEPSTKDELLTIEAKGAWPLPAGGHVRMANAGNAVLLAARDMKPVLLQNGQTITLDVSTSEGNQKGGKGE